MSTVIEYIGTPLTASASFKLGTNTIQKENNCSVTLACVIGEGGSGEAIIGVDWTEPSTNNYWQFMYEAALGVGSSGEVSASVTAGLTNSNASDWSCANGINCSFVNWGSIPVGYAGNWQVSTAQATLVSDNGSEPSLTLQFDSITFTVPSSAIIQGAAIPSPRHHLATLRAKHHSGRRS